jgi:hypothetical protein
MGQFGVSCGILFIFIDEKNMIFVSAFGEIH